MLSSAYGDVSHQKMAIGDEDQGSGPSGAVEPNAAGVYVSGGKKVADAYHYLMLTRTLSTAHRVSVYAGRVRLLESQVFLVLPLFGCCITVRRLQLSVAPSSPFVFPFANVSSGSLPVPKESVDDSVAFFTNEICRIVF